MTSKTNNKPNVINDMLYFSLCEILDNTPVELRDIKSREDNLTMLKREKTPKTSEHIRLEFFECLDLFIEFKNITHLVYKELRTDIDFHKPKGFNEAESIKSAYRWMFDGFLHESYLVALKQRLKAHLKEISEVRSNLPQRIPFY